MFDGNEFPWPDPDEEDETEPVIASTGTRLDDLDLAKIDPCPGCGTPTRRMASVPIRGHGLDGEPAGPIYCNACLKANVVAACVGLPPLPPGRKVYLVK